MILDSIQIRNYRSIEKIDLEIMPNEDASYTYGLIGINEAGKSSILRGIELIEGNSPLTLKDFRDKSSNITVVFTYRELDDLDNEWINQHLSEKEEFKLIKRWDHLDYQVDYLPSNFQTPSWKISVVSIDGKKIASIDLDAFLEEFVLHSCVFWTSEERYLISKPINIANFSAKPESVSIPLRNCFLLAGISDIKSCLTNLESDSTEIEYVENSLGKKVTQHIKNVWPNHPIEITFKITNGHIHFHIKDLNSDKAKTADQRSDGFKQFISFLLTLSAENMNSELEDMIVLLDEPETHLHPKAQEYFLGELKKLTKSDKGNIVIFSTHSNYMIDKSDLSRNFKVIKDVDCTRIVRMDKKLSSYSSVTYEVFEIASTDYHNELYSSLHEEYQNVNLEDEKRSTIKNFDINFFINEKKLKADYPFKEIVKGCSLPTYIRNCIHHSDNGNTYTEEQLNESIKTMRKYLGIN